MDDLENLSSQQETVEGAGVVTEQETETAPADSVPEEGKAAEATSGTEGKQSRKENARYAEARRAGAEEGAKRERERINKMLARQGIPDPTAEGKTLDSVDAIESYGITYRANKRDVDPSVIREEDEVRSWKEERDAEQAAKAESEAAQKDLEEFHAKFPDVDLEELAKSKAFERYAGKRLGKESLADIYGDYQDFMDEVQESKERASSKKQRDTGAGGGSSGMISASQQKELDRWNEMFPEYAMTAAEFLKR